MKKKIAVILFNLGGPSDIKGVKPFLFNLFFDKAIIRLPTIFRYPLAKLISSRREKTAIEIYSKIGGGSPILENTIAQAKELKASLQKHGKFDVFIAMRHSKPGVKEALEEVKKYDPEEIILLPLYPQLSSTTTGSSVDDFAKNFDKSKKVKIVCCYPTEKNFIISQTSLIQEKTKDLQEGSFRILFSAHGLPEKIVKSGDPYQWQVEQTCAAIVEKLPKNLDFQICYQSRVGPLKWIGPSTENEIVRASNDGKIIIMVPISFVSEHSETLVELDMEYKHIATENNCPEYIRVPTVSTEESFIKSLEEQVVHLANIENENSFEITNLENKKLCPKEFCNCLFEKGKTYG